MSMFRREPKIEPGDRMERDLSELLVAATQSQQRAEVNFGKLPKAPALTIPEKRERLDFLMAEFVRHHDAARQAAIDYVTEHTSMLEELALEKAKVEEHLASLDKIAAGMPTFGGSNETPTIIVSGPSPGNDDIPSPGRVSQDPVPIKPLEGPNKPLSLNRRQEVLVRRPEQS